MGQVSEVRDSTWSSKPLADYLREQEFLYSIGRGTLSDLQYDRLAILLEYLQEEDTTPSPQYHEPTGRSQHLYIVQSIKGYHRFNDVLRWITRQRRELLVQPKVDGVNLTLQVANGTILDLVTRGNGQWGISKLALFPYLLGLQWEGTGAVKFECYWEKRLPLTGYSDARSLVAGILNSKQPPRWIVRRLGLIVTDVIGEVKVPEALEWVPTVRFNDSGTKVLQEMVQRSYPYATDGLVLKVPTGRSNTSKYRLDAIAWKFYEPEVAAVARGVVWQVGRQGKVTPVLQVASEQKLQGRIIKQVTLHNHALLSQYNLGLEDRVFVKLAGLVIPQISRVERGSTSRITPIERCPVCDTSLREFTCINDYCEGRFRAYITYVTSRYCLDLKGVSGFLIKHIPRVYRSVPGFIWLYLHGRLCFLVESKVPRSSKSYSNYISALAPKPIRWAKIVMMCNIANVSLRQAEGSSYQVLAYRLLLRMFSFREMRYLLNPRYRSSYHQAWMKVLERIT